MEPQRQILVNQTPYTTHGLYDRYAGMLLGYLSAIVKDHQQAEQHLISIFNTIPQHLSELNSDTTNTWCQLQRIAKSHLSNKVKFGVSHNTAAASTAGHSNTFLDKMTSEQRIVFCSMYYNGKTTAQLSAELNKPEELIRKALKEAFAIIRKRA